MPRTVVTCSSCGEPATMKAAAPWKDGAFAELKTYGYACPGHGDAVLASAAKRSRPRSLAPTESVGEIQLYPLAQG